MRILYIPMYDNYKNPERSSSYLWAKIFFRPYINKKGYYIYFCIPKDAEYSFEEIRGKNVKLIEVDTQKYQMGELLYIDDKVIKLFRQSGEYIIDLIVNDKIFSNTYISLNINDVYYNIPKIKTVVPIQFSFAYNVDKLLSSMIEENDILYEALGNMSADILVYPLRYIYERAKDYYRRFLSYSQIEKLDKKVMYGLSSVDTRKVYKYAKEVKKEKRPIKINYANALTTQYRLPKIIDIVDTLYKTGEDVEFVITTGSKGYGFDRDINKYKYLKVYYGLHQEDFYKVGATCHIGVCLLPKGEVNASLIEQHILGQAIVYKDAEYYKEWLIDDYPYIVKDTREMISMLKYLIKNYWSDEVQGVIKRQREYLMDNWDGIAISKQIIKRAEEELAKQDAKIFEKKHIHLKQLLARNFVGRRDIWFSEVIDILKRKSYNRVDVVKMRSKVRVSKQLIHRQMLYLGFRDICDSEEPHYVKEEGVKIKW